MPSFPADPGPSTGSPGAELLQTIAARYDEALGAVLQGQFERLDLLLDDVDRIIQVLPAGPGTPTDRVLHLHALERHGALLSAMQGAKDTLGEEIGRLRNGRTVVHGYRAHTEDDRGRRIDADA